MRDEHLSFRPAHQIAAATGQSVIANSKPLADGFSAFQTAFEAAVGRVSKLDAAEFTRVVSAEYFVAVRDRFGGPAPAPMERALTGYRVELKELLDRAAHHKMRKNKAAETLQAEFARLLTLKTEN